MEPSLPMWLLAATLALQLGHLGMHVWAMRGAPYPNWARDDAVVGYIGALAWLLMVITTRGTLALAWWVGLVIGLPLVAVGLWLHAVGIRDMRRYRAEGALVTRGVYAKLRHPIYYGWVVVANAMPLVALSWLGLVTAPVWCVIVLAIALLEERGLRVALPPGEYDAYADGTWL